MTGPKVHPADIMDSVHRLVSPLLAGRELELRSLLDEFGDVVAGNARTVLVGAEAGGGKSRLVQEFTARVRPRARVLQGACVELTEAGVPFGPVVGILRTLVRDVGADGVSGLVGEDGARELAWLLPSLGAPPAARDAGMTRGRVFEVLLGLVTRLAEEKPLVLVLEDLHWADPATRDVLSFLVSNLDQAAVLLLVTHRSDDLSISHPLRHLLHELSRRDGVTRLALPPLTRRQVADQLEGILGRPAGASVVTAVHQRGAGIPLFTESLLGVDGGLRSEIPRSLQEAVLASVRTLSDESQVVLNAISVGGPQVSHALLAAVTGWDNESLVAAIRPAADANVLRNEGEGYAFRHDVIRRSVESNLLAGERIRLHRTYAVALTADQSASQETWHSVAVALHWKAAGEHSESLSAAWAAAADAQAGLAYPEQLLMLDQVMQEWPHVSPESRPEGVEQSQVLELATDAACWAADEGGLALVEAALAELDEDRDGERVGAMLVQRAAMRYQQVVDGEVDDLRRGVRLLVTPTPLRAECLAQLCRALLRTADPAGVAVLARDLVALADQLDDEEARVEAVITAAQVGTWEGRDTTADLQAAIERSGRLGSGRLAVLAYPALIEGLEQQCRHDEAIAAGREALRRTVQVGQDRYIGAAITQLLAESLASSGRWDEAITLLDDALAGHPAPYGRAHLLLCRGQLAVGRGDHGTVAQVLADLAAPPTAPEADGGRALRHARLEIEHLLASDDVRAAVALARQAASAVGSASLVWPLVCTAMRACATAAALGPTHPVPGLVETREALEGKGSQLRRATPLDEAYAALFSAELSSAAGQPDLAAWDAAATAWLERDHPEAAAYALTRAAVIHATSPGARDAVAERLAQAEQLADGLGAAPLLKEIRSVARRARVELRPGHGRSGSEVPFGLTGRELEVLRLVADGRSNREIAGELFISAKTASVHVSNILAKLGVSTRGAAAATAHREHLLTLD